jgi:hypothetical protein
MDTTALGFATYFYYKDNTPKKLALRQYNLRFSFLFLNFFTAARVTPSANINSGLKKVQCLPSSCHRTPLLQMLGITHIC